MYVTKYLYTGIAMLLIAPVQVDAAQWYAKPVVSLQAGYNDNIRMTPRAHDAVWETRFTPSVQFGVARENQNLAGDVGFSVRRYLGGSGRESGTVLNREDYHFRTDAFHRTPRNEYNLNLGYTNDSTLDSELDQTGNVIEDRATSERLHFNPGWTTLLTETTSLDLEYKYTNVDYSDDPGLADLVNYDSHVVSAALEHRFTPRVSARLVTSLSSFLPDTDFNSETLSVMAGTVMSLSETLSASLLAGQHNTTSDALIAQGLGFCISADPGASYPTCNGGIPVPTGPANFEVGTTGLVYSASIGKTLETYSFDASLTRSTQPGGNGELLDATRFVVNAVRALTETLEASVRLEYAENDTIVNRVGFPVQETEKFYRITPRVNWRWRRAWTLAGEYQHARNDNAGGTVAGRNAVYVTVTYTPPRWSLSR